MYTCWSLIVTLILWGCGSSSEDKDSPTPEVTSDSQTPPTGAAAVEAWLQEGHYLQWNCESEKHSARSGSAHGTNRVCSNTKLAGTADDTVFPVGAASVKELFKNDEINGFAVMLHTSAEDSGQAWYYYERIGTSTIADGNGVSLCDGCHSEAGQDGKSGHHRIYTIVR